MRNNVNGVIISICLNGSRSFTDLYSWSSVRGWRRWVLGWISKRLGIIRISVGRLINCS